MKDKILDWITKTAFKLLLFAIFAITAIGVWHEGLLSLMIW